MSISNIQGPRQSLCSWLSPVKILKAAFIGISLFPFGSFGSNAPLPDLQNRVISLPNTTCLFKIITPLSSEESMDIVYAKTFLDSFDFSSHDLTKFSLEEEYLELDQRIHFEGSIMEAIASAERSKRVDILSSILDKVVQNLPTLNTYIIHDALLAATKNNLPATVKNILNKAKSEQISNDTIQLCILESAKNKDLLGIIGDYLLNSRDDLSYRLRRSEYVSKHLKDNQQGLVFGSMLASAAVTAFLLLCCQRKEMREQLSPQVITKFIQHPQDPQDTKFSEAIAQLIEKSPVLSKYQCPISQKPILEIVKDPNGKTYYEKTAIETWIQTNPTSPLTNQPLDPSKLIACPNEQKEIDDEIKRVIESINKLADQDHSERKV